MFPPDQSWQPEINWETPAGQTLLQFLARLPRSEPFEIIVFGSAPLQLGLDPHFLSGDIDIISSVDLTAVIHESGLGKGQCPLYIEQTAESIFVASVTWRERAYTAQIESVRLIFPHPIDILVSKVRRLEAKDLEAFHLVREKTGHPTEDELRTALQRVVDIYRPAFDEENAGDTLSNTRVLWQELYGHDIDVRAEIIQPALLSRRAAYGAEAPAYKDHLREIGATEN